MIKPEMVPLEVWLALRDHVRERPYGYDYTEAIAAALNAWPGMDTIMLPRMVKPGHFVPQDYIRLPLPQEGGDE